MYTRRQFIERIAPLAVEDMRRTGVPASLTIAQAVLESADGNSALARLANNLFGIKGSGPAGYVVMPTKEHVGGRWITVNAKFRKYNDWSESIADHSKLLLNGVSWNRNLYRGAIGVDGKTAAYAVAKAGYATDPKYADKLIAIMDQYNLYQYDEMEKKPTITAVAFDEKKEANKVRLEKEWQWTMLRDALKLFRENGILNDAAWEQKAEKREFTESELAWLTLIIARRLMEERMLKEGKR